MMTTDDEPRRRKPPEPPIQPQSSLEEALYDAQADVVRAADGLRTRNTLLVDMRNRGYSLRQMTGILNAAAADLGGEPVTEDAVQKAIRRTREGD
jgi:hypothetical protein